MDFFPNRRQFLAASNAIGIWASTAAIDRAWVPADMFGPKHAGVCRASAHSIIPVVGDGKWIWRQPPEDQSGQLEPRTFEVRVGISATAPSAAVDFLATTPAPATHPEQEILDVQWHKDGCEAECRSIGESAAQLMIAAPHIPAEATIRAEAIFQVRVCKSFHNYGPNQFPMRQEWPRTIRDLYLGTSPGIQLGMRALDRIVEETTSASDHPWDKAKAFHQWVFDNIRGVPGAYTSVRKALDARQGDCEERAGVFIALCRTAGIPARLVWVPQHVWAEFLLNDAEGKPHWIPAHTAAYSWFGWTGAHEVVLQKGDRIRQPGPNRDVRLLLDWWSCGGTKPKLDFTASIRPLPEKSGGDPGPGARIKLPDGRWKLVGDHADDKHMRI
jgi:hypothetical protein